VLGVAGEVERVLASDGLEHALLMLLLLLLL
jgi:hypothetical protein